MKLNLKIILPVVILIIAGSIFMWQKKETTTPEVIETPQEEETRTPPQITEEDINETNFTGKKAVIAGVGNLVTQAQKYIDDTISDFKKRSDEEVPDLKEEFGSDSAISNYNIELAARYLEGVDTESIIISEYTYTGGASGNSAYKVITTDKENGKVLSLGDVIKSDQKTNLVNLVKSELLAWRPEGTDGIVVFEDEVKNLTFDSFKDWSLDENNLVIYFDKYEVGPGALGAVVLPIARGKIKNFLQP